jgi:hypothetical protein
MNKDTRRLFMTKDECCEVCGMMIPAGKNCFMVYDCHNDVFVYVHIGHCKDVWDEIEVIGVSE